MNYLVTIMSGGARNDSNKGFLSSANIKQAFNLEHPRTSLQLAKTKATKEKSMAKQVVGNL